MRIGPYDFRPGFVPTLAVVIVLPLLAALGFWQLERAKETQAYLDSLEAGRQAGPVSLGARLPAYPDIEHRIATARGRYDSAHQFLLDNQTYKGRVGYHVLTPFRLREGDSAVLVDRGWVLGSINRDVLPDVAVPETARRVQGVVDKGPSVGIRLGEAYRGEGAWPRRLGYVDFRYISEALPYRVAPYLIRLDPRAEGGFVREPPKPAMGPERNIGYAVQWFAMASAVVIIYILVNLKRISHDK